MYGDIEYTLVIEALQQLKFSFKIYALFFNLFLRFLLYETTLLCLYEL
jgi:hypothetical protein